MQRAAPAKQQQMPPLRAWLLAARPQTLSAAAAPVIAGTALAAKDAGFNAPLAAACMSAALLIQIGTNLANDYFDYQSGADNDQRLGPPRVTQHGWLMPRQVAWGAALSFALAALFGVYLAQVGGWPIVIVGLVSIACGVAYTGGPFPFGYHGLGEAAVWLFFGPIAVGGSYFLQAGTLSSGALIAGTCLGWLSSAILVVNNIRDRHSDAAASKRTLAVRLGLRASRVEYAALMLLPYGLTAVYAVTSDSGWALPLTSIPLALRQVRYVVRADGRQLNRSLSGTAQIALLFALLLAAGVHLLSSGIS